MIYVIDSVMGSGKTTLMLDKINKGEIPAPILYVSPLLSEVEQRLPEALPEWGFECPKVKGTKNKSDNLEELLVSGANVGCSHELLRRLTKKAVKGLKENNYTIIIDEAIQAYQLLDTKADDVKALLKSGHLIYVDEEAGQVEWNWQEHHDYDGAFMAVKQASELGALHITPNYQLLLWEYPEEVLGSDMEIYVMTYLFEGSLLHCWMKSHNIPYTIMNNEDLGLEDEVFIKARIRDNLSIYEGTHNSIGKRRGSKNPMMDTALSSSDLSKTVKRNKAATAVYNVFRRDFQLKSTEVIYTSIKKDGGKPIKPNGYARSFVPCNTRATNDYAEAKGVAYVMNLYANPSLKLWVDKNAPGFNEEQFALSEMIQFLWRGCIRKGEPMQVYVPSCRMRKLLTDWLGMDEVK